MKSIILPICGEGCYDKGWSSSRTGTSLAYQQVETITWLKILY
ncbi:MAG: hypothetical protein RIC35_09075 [Marinoscillum sp.]